MGFLDAFLRRQRPPSGTDAGGRKPASAVTRPAQSLAALAEVGLPDCWLDSAALTDVGLVRSNNEDNVRLLPDAGRGVAMALLADGMGGHASGEVASAMALESMMAQYTARDPDQALPDFLHDAIVQANRAVWQHAQAHPEMTGMGTTLCALVFDPQGVYVGWVGDSRIYHWRDAVLQPLTRDDTLVSRLLAEGLLTQAQAEAHPDGHVLSQALGTHEALQEVHVQRLDRAVEVGDVFVLTSDGVHDVLAPDTLAALLAGDDVHRVAQSLIHAAKEAASTDNLSAVVVRVTAPRDRSTPMATTRC